MEKVIYEDIPNIRPLQTLSSLKMKKLLAYLSISTVPTFNISSLTYEIEIGGRNKNMRQLANVENGLLFKDGIEHGVGPQIPLYLAGFLY